MKPKLLLIAAFVFVTQSFAQNMMTPELLWKLKRISPVGLSDDGKQLIYSVTEYKVEEGKRETRTFVMPVKGGTAVEIKDYSDLISPKSVSPDKTKKIEVRKVQLENILGKDLYPTLQESNVYIYNDLDRS